MGTNWESLIKHNIIKICITVLILAFVAIICVGLFTNKHINMFGLEFNSPNNKSEDQNKSNTENKEKKDTGKSHTVTLKLPTKLTFRNNQQENYKQNLSKDTPTATIINGKNINTGVNNGNIGDVYNEDVPVQRILSQTVLNECIYWIEKLKKDKAKTDKNVTLTSKDGDYEASVVVEQLKKYLESKGYQVVTTWMISQSNIQYDMYPLYGPEDEAWIHVNSQNKLRKINN